jgi:hypothetical protein
MDAPHRLAVVLVMAALSASMALGQGTSGPVVNDSRAGYIDAAIPGNQVRLRFDTAYNNARPTRAEFFWPKAGSPAFPGPPFREPSVDYQEFHIYGEYAFTPRFSTFVEMPLRLVNPTVDVNARGVGDINAGFKYAFLYEDAAIATFQLRTFIPTGDARLGLGTHHVSLEPAILAYAPLTDRLIAEGEFRTWVPIGGTDFAGTIVRYGLGASYNLLPDSCWRVSPVAELVGWTVLGGKESFVAPDGSGLVESAAGDTIVNAKLGLRVSPGPRLDIYTGYGRALTGDRWYENTFRVEVRFLY